MAALALPADSCRATFTVVNCFSDTHISDQLATFVTSETTQLQIGDLPTIFSGPTLPKSYSNPIFKILQPQTLFYLKFFIPDLFKLAPNISQFFGLGKNKILFLTKNQKLKIKLKNQFFWKQMGCLSSSGQFNVATQRRVHHPLCFYFEAMNLLPNFKSRLHRKVWGQHERIKSLTLSLYFDDLNFLLNFTSLFLLGSLGKSEKNTRPFLEGCIT